MDAKPVLSVVGALIETDGRFLVCQRRADDTLGSMWEFPGGTVEPGESDETALRREISEELGVDISVGNAVGVFTDDLGRRSIEFRLYRCSIRSGRPQAIDCQDLRLATIGEISALDLTPVDRKALPFIAGGSGARGPR